MDPQFWKLDSPPKTTSLDRFFHVAKMNFYENSNDGGEENDVPFQTLVIFRSQLLIFRAVEDLEV